MKHIILIACMSVQFLAAQKLSHPLHAEAAVPAQRQLAAADTVHVLVLRVQFQPDNDSRTSGNGQFDLTTSNERIIDAPPHDSAYFADHMTFARNYFAKASNGKQHIASTVLPNIVTVGKQMKEYAPVAGNGPLGLLIEESWKAADSLHPSFPFDQFDLFIIFHAGVGKDIDLRAALGFDPTPLDLPSLYFSLKAMRTLFGSSYQGVQLKNSSFKIPNTALLPETEVRKIPSVGGDIVLKLGMNGLIAATIGSHLGLPDLFDTKTGKSAIGRFGLMDGQSIFSFMGAAPPEPSAWEKAYLGWTTPIEAPVNTTLAIPAAGLHNTGNDTIYRIPISAKEYFLVENRHRDAKANGQTVTMRWNGQTITKTFTQDHDYFYSSNIDSVYGVILDVDEPDWSLPGLINANNQYHGGILIWHIDEQVIEKNIAANAVNADPARRGVDLEEADGSQDIGQSYNFGDPASGSEDGSPIDYWFSGNIFPDYKNEFSETTFPNSLSNTLAKTNISLKNFSAQSPRMTFEVRSGGGTISTMKIIKRFNAKTTNDDGVLATDLDNDGTKELIYTCGDSIYVFHENLTPYLNNTTGLFSPVGGRTQPVVVSAFGDPASGPMFRGLAGISGKSIYLLSSVNKSAVAADTTAVYASASAITTPLLYDQANNGSLHFGTAGKELSTLTYNPAGSVLTRSSNVLVADIPRYLSRRQGTTTVFSSENIFSPGTVHFSGKEILSGTQVSFQGSRTALFFPAFVNGGAFAAPGLHSETRNVLGKVTSSIAVADFEGDNRLEVLVGTDKGLYCVNEYGAVRENYPLPVTDGGSIVGSPLIVKLKTGNEWAVLFGSTNGHLYGYTSGGKRINGFPLQTGGISSTPVLIGEKLIAASTDTSIYVWNVPGLFDTANIRWDNYLGNHFHSNYSLFAGTSGPRSSELLPAPLAYNWPNPVYGMSTFIRYFLGKPATVKITIVNLAGELVEELQGPNITGIDNELEWNVSNIQSGIYFAQITAAGNGEEARRIVKIAVVK